MSEVGETSARPALDRRVTAWLAIVVLVGLLLRLYRLDEQSLWWDDYNGIAHLAKDGFFASMAESRRMNPEGAPLYHFIQYLASFVIGTGEYMQRMLNVLISTATILVVYAIGRNSFGARAGLVAALLFALSPPLIYHAQSLRIYPLAVLTAALALLTMERMITQPRPSWLYLNALANGAACLTHLFGLFGVLAQGTAMLILFGWRDWRFLMRWSIVQFICLLPSALIVLTMRARSGGDFWHFHFPSPYAIFLDLFGDDLTNANISRTPWAFEFFGINFDAPWLDGPIANIMMGIFVVVALWSLAQVLWIAWRDRAKPAASRGDARQSRLVLMLCFWALPVAYLLLLAYIWEPVIKPRYTLYACIGLYVMTGAFVQAIPWARLRPVLVAVLVVVYAYQVLLLIPSETRTQWRAVAQDIAEQAGPGDFVMVGTFGPPDISHRTFAYHFPSEVDIPITRAFSSLDAMEQLRCHFTRHQGDATPPAAWYVYNSHYHLGNPDVFGEYLIANEVPHRRTSYAAEEYIVLFHVARWDGAGPDTPIAHPELSVHMQARRYDHAADMRMLGFEDDHDAFAHDFERAFEDGIIFGDERSYLRSYVQTFLDFHRLDTAREAIERFEARTGEEVPFLRWSYHFVDGNLDEALAVLCSQPPEFFQMLHNRSLLDLTLWAAGERGLARESYGRYQHLLNLDTLHMTPLFDARLRLDDDDFRAFALEHRATLYPHNSDGHEYLVYRVSGLEHWVSACTPPWQAQPVAPETVAAARELLGRLTP